MKKLLALIIVFISLTIVVQAEVYKFRTSAFAIAKFNTYSQTWGSYSAWTPTNVAIIIDATNERVTIYSATEQVYEIIELLTNTKGGNGHQTMSWQCIDASGTKCVIRILIRTTSELYVDYSNVSWVYSLKSL